MNSTFLLFLSRLLTKSGDNAWVFAVPMALVHIYPDSLRPVSLFFLILRILVMLLMPAAGRWLDKKSRPAAITSTILPQIPLMMALTLCIGLLGRDSHLGSGLENPEELFFFGLLICFAALSQASSHLSSVLLTADFIPNLFRDSGLTKANTTLRRIDLLTEILSPIATGFVLAFFPWDPVLFSGFAMVALWNIISFALEFFVLRSFLLSGILPPERNFVRESQPKIREPRRSLREDLRLFRSQPAFLTMVGLSLMHIQVLSPPNVVGTSFLKAGWHLSEDIIGVFRGLGAVVSIFATAFVGGIIRRRGLARSTALFSSLQGLFLCCTGVAFLWGPSAAPLYLLGIILSRFGHSGFILCEMQIRQETIPQARLGLINGIAVSMNAIGSFIILSLGVVFSDPEDFGILVWTSCAAVLGCWLTARYWAFAGPGAELEKFCDLTRQAPESLKRVA